MSSKKLLPIIFLIVSSLNVDAQCDIKKLHRPDGVTVRYFNPLFVGSGAQCELGGSIYLSESQFTLATTVRYFGAAKKTVGTLIIQLSNDVGLELEMIENQLAVSNNSEVSLSVFYLTKSDVANLKRASIKTIIFKEAGGRSQIVSLSENKSFAADQIRCLE